jgi:sugar lactone lactonase YvrE
MRRLTKHVVLITIAAAIVAAPLGAAGRFPERIPLPDNFQPEGIAIGKGARFYVGSIPTGAIYRGNLRTGRGVVINPGGSGRAAVGVHLCHHRLYVAGGRTGKGFVYNPRTGALLATHQLTGASPTFINDVVTARGAAYFTDSNQPFIYRVGRNGVQAIRLTGDYAHQPGQFNANGIDTTRNEKTLIIVQTQSNPGGNVSKLFTVDPTTGVTRQITVNQPITNGDGIHLDGRTLYVVQNRDNRVAVIRLSRDLSSGTVTRQITDTDFDVPTTIDEFGRRLYAVNARFRPTGTPPEREYWIAAVRKVRGGR